MLLFTYLNNRVRRHIINATRAAGWVASESLHRFFSFSGQSEAIQKNSRPGEGDLVAIAPDSALTVGGNVLFRTVVHSHGASASKTPKSSFSITS